MNAQSQVNDNEMQGVEDAETAETAVHLDPLTDTAAALRILEALLFAAPKPLTIQQLLERLPSEMSDDLSDYLEMLQDQYKDRGVQLVSRGGAWAFRTADDVTPYLNIEKQTPKKLTNASLETLAIVAYHQPVTRAEIESIRGVSVGRGTLDLLMEAGWVKPGRRRQVPGRPLTWVTTPHFLDHFGLVELKDLPGLDDLKAAGLMDTRPAIEAMPQTRDLLDDEAARTALNVDIEQELDIIDPYEDTPSED